jgi:hypothetical protein
MVLASSPRYGTRIDWAALHSAEGARTVGSLYSFFDRGQHASSHAGADGYELSDGWVPDERAAWTLLNGNPRSLNLELCGFARWTRPQWLSEGWVDGVWNPRQMVRHAGLWLQRKCDRHDIPKRLLTPEQVGRGERGIIDHFRYTIGKKDGNHTDVGMSFPFDVALADMNSASGGGADPQEDNEMNLLVKGNKSAACYVVSVTADGRWKRHIDGPEKDFLVASGVKLHEHNQYDVDIIPERSAGAAANWNYKTPTEPGDAPSEYLAAHQVLATVNQNTTPALRES